MNYKIGLISLGCDKNRVDSEKILYKLKAGGCKLVQDATDADFIIINTCAFIESAKKESIDTVLECAALKKKHQKIVVAGCLAQRYKKELKESLPEADVVITIDEYNNFTKLLNINTIHDARCTMHENCTGRILTTPPHYAYLKIADGCDNCCSYCAIPSIRGAYRSYPMNELLKEAQELCDDGVKELILVAQDITRYNGRWEMGDGSRSASLIDLLNELIKLPFYKIRLLYVYPELVTDELISMVANESKIAKYLDIPMQHINDNILKKMNRRTNGMQQRELVKKIKAANKNIVIRSSFIVGFPSETEEEFRELKEFIASGSIDYAGFFAYSQEEGTPAATMKPQLSKSVKNKRLKELSQMQSAVIVEKHKKYLNKTLKVIYEGIDYSKKMFVGRTEFNTPDADTKVYFKSQLPLEIGEVYEVKITKTGFNLLGEVLWN
jgi:ribosomal protein S12 methylthiotransferase